MTSVPEYLIVRIIISFIISLSLSLSLSVSPWNIEITNRNIESGWRIDVGSCKVSYTTLVINQGRGIKGTDEDDPTMLLLRRISLEF